MRKDQQTAPDADANATFADRFHAALSRNVHLSDETRAEFSAAMKPVLENLGSAAHSRLNHTVRDFQFFENPQTLTDYLNLNLPKKRGKRPETGGAYSWRPGETSGVLLLNGVLDERYDTTAVYAHEIGHALDGPDKAISRQPAWASAWRRDIRQQGAISARARESAYEGFAEFCRYRVTSGLDDATLESMFPNCFAIWRQHTS